MIIITTVIIIVIIITAIILGETLIMQHIICECKKLAQREYKRRHDTVAKLVHCKLCEKHNFERKEKW